MEKKIGSSILVFVIFWMLVACNGSATPIISPPTVDISAIQTLAVKDALAQLTADSPIPTDVADIIPTEIPTKIPTQTSLPSPTNPLPTNTLSTTSTPQFEPQTQTLGPIHDTVHDSTYSVELTLQNVEWFTEDTYDEPKEGYIYVVAHIKLTNLGPGELRSVGLYDFQILDENGVVRDYEMLSKTIDTCQIETVDLMVNGKVEGCATFEVPLVGKMELIYAPYNYEGLEPGRYISFFIR